MEAVQRLEERVSRVQTELGRDMATVRDNQTRLEQRLNELPQQQRTATLPGQTHRAGSKRVLGGMGPLSQVCPLPTKQNFC